VSPRCTFGNAAIHAATIFEHDGRVVNRAG
jgi:hypothetical protein